MQTQQNLRGRWGSKVEFLFACIGYAVGLGNIWRFPYLCYTSGGGAFLFPYFIMLILCGIPLLYMEMAVGQLTRRGPVHAIAKLCPILKGTGIAMVMLSFLLCTYYNVIIAWSLHYFFHSFFNPLPWTGCNNTWNTIFCLTGDEVQNFTSTISNGDRNLTDSELDYYNPEYLVKHTSPSYEYFNYNVLGISNGIEDMGHMQGGLVGFLFLAWAICYFCLCKGVRIAGKVVLFTATFPYVILFVLLIRSVTLPGAENGIRYFMIPHWPDLGNPRIWLLAAAQVFNSIGIGFGSLIAFSSYNRRDNNILHDTLIIAIVNSLTSLLAGFVVFSALGGMAEMMGVGIHEVVSGGQELVFVVIPTLFSLLPLSNLWAVLFFLMLICLGIDSQFAMVEVINTSIMDELNRRFKNSRFVRKEIVALIVCLVCFLLGLPNVAQGGMYFFILMDHYSAVVSLMYVASFEVMAICWCYGASRLAKEISFLSKWRPPYFFPFCWLFISPALLTMLSNFTYSSQSVQLQYGDYLYPRWTQALGSFIALSSTIWILIGILHTVCTNVGTCKQRCGMGLRPTFQPVYASITNKRSEGIEPTNDEPPTNIEMVAQPIVEQPLLVEATVEPTTQSTANEGDCSSPPPDYESAAVQT
uniref:sodium- and chloride-dependent betaine transporter-like n=1 Tax=Styela clava TaxID=7725 RepID=UPI0019394036|nr:sodium- and chloride-dependent betaine transporter-like [Styela clava]